MDSAGLKLANIELTRTIDHSIHKDAEDDGSSKLMLLLGQVDATTRVLMAIRSCSF